eukprot:8408787-Karenia_brevis.AAC.1
MSEYVEVTESLEKIRAPWLEKVLMDDPMKADESQFRSTEKVFIKDLSKRNASSRLIKMAHNLPQRLSHVPDATVTMGGFVDNALKIDHLLGVLGAMRK